MAKNDTLGTILKLGIFAGLVFAAWLLYRWLKGYTGGDTIGGTSKTPGGGGDAGKTSGSGTVFGQIAGAYKKDIEEPTRNERYALELLAADVEAHQFLNKPGSNIVINKCLKKINSLGDIDFMDVINKFVKLTSKTDFLDTDLAGAQITTAAHSDILTRYSQLTGKVTFDNTKDLKTIGGRSLDPETKGAIATAISMIPKGL